MENEKQIPEAAPEDDWFAREERCRKAIRTVRKAIFMRIFVMVLLIWALLKSTMELWVVGLMAFVMIINLGGLLPLVAELKKRRSELKDILAEE